MGVTLKVGGDYWIDMSDYDFVLEVGSADITTFTKTKIVGYADGSKITITGSGFTADKYGYLVGGTVYSAQESYAGTVNISLTGLNLSVQSLVKVFNTASTADDLALVKSVLKGSDSLSGGSYADIIFGYDGNDKLYGKTGNDKLKGGAGDDKIHGGSGHDYLFGNSGKDTFIFKSVKDSTVGSLGRDTIYDFQGSEGDKIDLSAIDANTKLADHQAFKFIGKEVFHKKAGELRFDRKASDTFIFGDVDGDGKPDFAIHLDDALTFSKGHFLL
ncbi:hypothetical protein IB238_24055 [Rhizobium sp. ARZ01]|uniref:calcium-binding protein n=1 Tax=Rhizobium sp. ARZ01 TaxID=2769313 RepID=UPI00177CF599|nr:hypothetical protein [Rhizobium sp. ARZ01]MBD9375682.1 hypothetical protein [Rhizobium sp. ARZ01]